MPPAARIGDMHVCPMVDPGPKPHVGGPISVGAPNVLIGFMPAARVGDMAVCVGPPDAIAKGSMTVIIGGQPAARIGDMTVHGGMVTVGCPTVFIGDVGMGSTGAPEADAFGITTIVVIAAVATAGVVALVLSQPEQEEYSKGITVQGSDKFRKETRESLDRLKATETGKALLEDIGKSGKSVTISETKENNGSCRTKSSDANELPDGKPGTGSDSEVLFNPNFKPDGLPNEVVLGHELIHAQHNARGIRQTGEATSGKHKGTKNEELKTVGLPPYPESGLTENSLRKDLKLPQRKTY